MAYVTSTKGTLPVLGLLIKGCFGRSIRRAPVRALCYQILLPIAVISFVAFLDTGGPARTSWPTIAIAGTVWLLFANSVNYGGMVLWHERGLLRQSVIPVWLLLAAATLVPVGLFGLHLLLVHVALAASALPRAGAPIETLVAACMAVALGLGAGILAARLTGFRPNFAFTLPKLLLASLVLTPVFYRVSALDGLKDAFCVANPLCAATELARAGISVQAEALPRYATALACALSVAILCWALFTLSAPSPSFADEYV
jgi:ABC-type polysaccharide/polyol phosphate export permease